MYLYPRSEHVFARAYRGVRGRHERNIAAIDPGWTLLVNPPCFVHIDTIPYFGECPSEIRDELDETDALSSIAVCTPLAEGYQI